MNKKSGFTLAEVLITLGIIGVVAAMTIPTLIANTNSAKFKTGFKKDVSTLSQAALMAQAQYDVNYASLSAMGTTIDSLSEGNYTLCGLLNSTLAGVTIYQTAPKLANGTSYSLPTNTKLMKPINYAVMADGSMLIFSNRFTGCTEPEGEGYLDGIECMAFIDVNGTAGPNKIVNSGTSSTVAYDPGIPATPSSTAVVQNNAAQMTDIYPVFLHDGVVEPATPEAKYVLTSK